jgi:hypothetical protein
MNTSICTPLKEAQTQRLVSKNDWPNYNAERPHSTHGILTPNEAYASKTEPMKLAA